MSFPDDANSLRSKLHLERFNKIQLAGAALLVCALLVLAGGAFLQSAEGSGFSVQTASSQEGSLEEGSGAGGEGDAGQEGQDGRNGQGGSSADAGMPSGEDGSGNEAQASGALGQEVCVDVAGAVASPGLYRLPAGSRIDDAVKAAGGFAENAARNTVNLARPLSDGEQLLILNIEEAAQRMASGSSGSSGSASGAGSAAGAGSSAGAGTVTGPSGSASGNIGSAVDNGGGRVNINTAGVAELTTLKGVGEATAQKIVDYREKNGPFTKLTDLKKVSGIGDKKYEAMAANITL